MESLPIFSSLFPGGHPSMKDHFPFLYHIPDEFLISRKNRYHTHVKIFSGMRIGKPRTAGDKGKSNVNYSGITRGIH
jgi:hypothetical protein